VYSGNGLVNEVTLRRARLVLRWVTVHGFTVSVCNQPLRPTQLPILSGMGFECRLRAVLCGWEGNRGYSVALDMRHRFCGTVYIRLRAQSPRDLGQGDDHPACAATFLKPHTLTDVQNVYAGRVQR